LASALAHVAFFALPTPGAARHQRRAEDPLSLNLLAPKPAVEPDAAPPPEPEPTEPPPKPEPAPSEPARKAPPPSAPPEPATTAPPKPEAPVVQQPSTPAPADLDLDLKARPGRFAGGAASGSPTAGFTPRLETSPIPEGLEPAGGGTYRYDSRGFVAEIARDGSVSFGGGHAVEHRGSGVAFDVTEAVMAAAGDDAFHTEKVAFLERTAWFRDQLAARARKDDLREARRGTLARLRAIWEDGTLPLAERRRELFAMWDDCVESGPEEVVATGNFVRQTVLGFIRRRLPPGSPDAFTPDELDRLNADRDSVARFDPYAEPNAEPNEGDVRTAEARD
jgi:hypothetical protein